MGWPATLATLSHWISSCKLKVKCNEYTDTSSIVVQSHIDCLLCHCSIFYQAVIYPLRWRISSSVPQQSHHHRTSTSPESWNTSIDCYPIWCNPVSSRVSIVPISGSKMVSMTDESSVIRGANITDQHIAMVRDDVIVQTEVYTCIMS